MRIVNNSQTVVNQDYGETNAASKFGRGGVGGKITAFLPQPTLIYIYKEKKTLMHIGGTAEKQNFQGLDSPT